MSDLLNITILQPPYPHEGTAESAEECLKWMKDHLAQLNPGEQDIILLPEYAAAPGLDDQHLMQEFAQAQGSRFLDFISETAIKLNCLVVLNSPAQSGQRWLNRTCVFNPEGKLDFVYDKIHLTKTESAELGFTPGGVPQTFTLGNSTIGFAVCFDLYFPEYFSALAESGIDLILCPSYQRSETPERIKLIAQARALDSGAYLIRSSYSMGTSSAGGHSLIAGPDGSIIKDAGVNEGMFTVAIDLKQNFSKPASHGQPLIEHRALISTHRRPAIYADMTSSKPGTDQCSH